MHAALTGVVTLKSYALMSPADAMAAATNTHHTNSENNRTTVKMGYNNVPGTLLIALTPSLITFTAVMMERRNTTTTQMTMTVMPVNANAAMRKRVLFSSLVVKLFCTLVEYVVPTLSVNGWTDSASRIPAGAQKYTQDGVRVNDRDSLGTINPSIRSTTNL
jgi:hypothetical protein